ncbi:hypothetical protein [Nocardia noduli]|uniref:hypothetical protein n=1 Tax=Nocardia noduli TaxID=2815722 RepID=UPI001C2200E0|nr:hypothetical protein [Nocardia noduli]
MSTTETHSGQVEVDSPADRHHDLVLSMSRGRGSLLSALLGATESLPPRLEQTIDLAAQDVTFALYNVAGDTNIDVHRAGYWAARADLEAAVVEAGMSVYALGVLRVMLGDHLREAEHMAHLAVIAYAA